MSELRDGEYYDDGLLSCGCRERMSRLEAKVEKLRVALIDALASMYAAYDAHGSDAFDIIRESMKEAATAATIEKGPQG